MSFHWVACPKVFGIYLGRQIIEPVVTVVKAKTETTHSGGVTISAIGRLGDQYALTVLPCMAGK